MTRSFRSTSLQEERGLIWWADASDSPGRSFEGWREATAGDLLPAGGATLVNSSGRDPRRKNQRRASFNPLAVVHKTLDIIDNNNKRGLYYEQIRLARHLQFRPVASLSRSGAQLARRRGFAAAARVVPRSYTWASGSWCTLRAMSQSRGTCFTLKRGHSEIMADSGAKDGDKGVCVRVCVRVHGWWMRQN